VAITTHHTLLERPAEYYPNTAILDVHATVHIIKEVITIFVFRHCIYESFGKCFERVLGYWAGLINNRFQQYASIQMGRTNAKNSRSLKPTLALLNSVSYSL